VEPSCHGGCLWSYPVASSGEESDGKQTDQITIHGMADTEKKIKNAGLMHLQQLLVYDNILIQMDYHHHSI